MWQKTLRGFLFDRKIEMLGKLRWEPRWVKVCLCSCSIGGTLIAIGALLYILNGAETTLVTEEGIAADEASARCPRFAANFPPTSCQIPPSDSPSLPC